MKKRILYGFALSFLLNACSTSKNTNTGSNDATTGQQGNTPVAEKKIEKSVITDNTNPNPLRGQAPQERTMAKKKINTNTARTFEAAPSVPDTL
jgi:predicted component of type VI protein secretion system